MDNKFRQHSISHSNARHTSSSKNHGSSHFPIDPKAFRKKKKKRTGGRKILKGVLRTFLGLIILAGITAGVWLQKNVLSQLPDVSSIQDMVFSEATIIQDRHGETLYKIFHENRDYINYEAISPTMVDAIVSIEDKDFWKNDGLNWMTIMKTAFYNFTHPSNPRGGSGLPQQLLKNLLLNKDGKKETFKEKIVRKLKEIFLTSKLEDTITDQIKKEKGNLSKEELRTEMKKETLELYLNYVSFGNNAYGIEAAAKVYFGKKAENLDAMESAVLAALPKGPTYYNPYRHKDRTMGVLAITDAAGDRIGQGSGDVAVIDAAIKKYTNMLMNSSLANKRENEAFVDFAKGLGSFKLFHNGKNYHVEYKPGRKDVILARMYDDGYINEPELKNAFIKGLDYTFKKHKFEIKAPHFVHWVIERLEQEYDKETLMNGGFIIKTSLDYTMQQMAEKAVYNNRDMLRYYGATNEAMVYADSTNGDVLAYVGSLDYFNDEIEGQNDMLRSSRQIGSTMKPFIYALGFETIGMTTETPIYDIPFKIGRDEPNNADGKFYGILPLRNALAYSRNIPAIKVFLGLGGESVAKPYLKKLGMTSLIDDHRYGYPLAIGAGEIEMLELAQSYMHLSARGKPALINPILEIRTKDGSIVYQKEVEMAEEAMKPGAAYLLWNILSDKGNMPPGWVPKYSVAGLNLAIKSGTSNMKNKNDQNRARDGLLIGYTPSKVLIMRGGNADGTPMNKNAYGGFLNADALREFLGGLVKNNYIQNESMPGIETTTVQISKINGGIAGAGTPSEFTTSALTFAYKLPGKTDLGMTPIKYDKMCNGAISPYTPEADIANGYVIEASSFMPNNMDLSDIKQRWEESLNFSGSVEQDEEKRPRVTYNYKNMFLAEPTEVCEDRIPKIDDSISIEILKPGNEKKVTQKTELWFRVASTTRELRNVIVFVDNEQVAQFDYKGNKKNLTDIQPLDLSKLDLGTHTIRVEAVDVRGFGNQKSIEITTVETDAEAPVFLQDKMKIKELEEGGYEVMLLFEDDLSSVVGGRVMINGTTVKEFEGNLAVFTLTELMPVSVAVTDSYKNVLQQDINLTQ